MYVSEQEVRAVLTYEALIPAIRQALIDYSAGRVNQPPRMILRAGNADDHRNGWFGVMPVVAGDVMGVKTVTFYAGNDELGLHTHMAIIELMRPRDRGAAGVDGWAPDYRDAHGGGLCRGASPGLLRCISSLRPQALALSVRACKPARISKR